MDGWERSASEMAGYGKESRLKGKIMDDPKKVMGWVFLCVAVLVGIPVSVAIGGFSALDGKDFEVAFERAYEKILRVAIEFGDRNSDRILVRLLATLVCGLIPLEGLEHFIHRGGKS